MQQESKDTVDVTFNLGWLSSDFTNFVSCLGYLDPGTVSFTYDPDVSYDLVFAKELKEAAWNFDGKFMEMIGKLDIIQSQQCVHCSIESTEPFVRNNIIFNRITKVRLLTEADQPLFRRVTNDGIHVALEKVLLSDKSHVVLPTYIIKSESSGSIELINKVLKKLIWVIPNKINNNNNNNNNDVIVDTSVVLARTTGIGAIPNVPIKNIQLDETIPDEVCEPLFTMIKACEKNKIYFTRNNGNESLVMRLKKQHLIYRLKSDLETKINYLDYNKIVIDLINEFASGKCDMDKITELSLKFSIVLYKIEAMKQYQGYVYNIKFRNYQPLQLVQFKGVIINAMKSVE